MGLTKKGKQIKPYGIVQASSNFNYEFGIRESVDITSDVVSNREDIILLYKNNYQINTNLVAPAKYIRGILKQNKWGYSYYPSLNLQQQLNIAGTWIIENVYITGNALNLQTGAKLILKNCYLYFTANESFTCINATNGALILDNSKVQIAEIGSAIINVAFGNDVQLYNSSIDNYKFSSSTGTLYLENSYLGRCDGGVNLSGYNIIAKGSNLGFGHNGMANIDILGSELRLMLASAGTKALQGIIKNSIINNLVLSNQTGGTLRILNCVFDKIQNETWSGIININGGNPTIYVENCRIRNAYDASQYILQCNNSNATIYFIECNFLSTLGRFYKTGTGTNAIRTLNCSGNKATDTGFGAGEITDTNFIVDTNIPA